MAKEIKGFVKLTVPAGAANPAPPIGPALGAKGVNIAEFCKQFNDATKDKEKGMPIPVVITVYTDRSFEFIMRLPPVSYLIKKVINLKQGSKKPGLDIVAKISQADLRKVAEQKMADLNCTSVESAMRIVAGQARSMGIKAEEA
ncbi:MAG: 50S ribosomal protein L11 [Rickettsiales bacterium]|jgi:large subunit ribosomal protein L11|nr:50S ribosomal protein L11 [Rickettsiales bacterium]